MPDAIPSLSSGSAAEPVVYRPVSVLAIAGLSIAVVYAAVVVLVAVSAWRPGAPLLHSWALVLAVAGALLSMAARFRILRSAGMQVGLRLANWGLGLSVVLGLVHGAILVGKDLAVRQEASGFSADWFEKLRHGGGYRAFLLSLPASQRQDYRAFLLPGPPSPGPGARSDEDLIKALTIRYGAAGPGEKGPLLLFLEHELVQAVRQAGDDAKIESLGVSGWSFDGGGYLVEQSFRITTPEGVFEVVLPLRSAAQPVPGGAAVGRQWQVMMTDPRIVRRRHPTPLGEQLIALRQSAGRFVEEWGRQLDRGSIMQAYLDTCPPEQRQRLREELAVRLAVAGIAAGTSLEGTLVGFAWSATAEPWCFPGVAAFAPGRLFRTDQLMTPSDLVTQAIRRALHDLGRSTPLQIKVPTGPQLDTCPWTMVASERHITVPVEVRLGSKYYCEGTATVAFHAPEVMPPVPAASPWRIIDFNLLVGSRVSRTGPTGSSTPLVPN